MVGDLLQPTHLLFVLAVALLVLGPKRLPEVGRALGRGLRDFRNAMSGEELPEQTASTTEASSASPQPSPVAAETPTAEAQAPTGASEPVAADTAPTEVQAPTETPEPVASSVRGDSTS